MVADNHNTSLVLRALPSRTTLKRQRLGIGVSHNDLVDYYNTIREENYPYEDIEPLDLFEGTRNWYNSLSHIPFWPEQGSLADPNFNQSLLVVKGPYGPYHNHIGNYTPQPAYWEHKSPSSFFEECFIDFETTGTINFTYDGVTRENTPVLYDSARDINLLPAVQYLESGGYNFVESELSNTDFIDHPADLWNNRGQKKRTRGLDLSSGFRDPGDESGFLYSYWDTRNRLRNREFFYDLQGLSHTSNNTNFTVYMKYRPTGVGGVVFENNAIQIFAGTGIEIKGRTSINPDGSWAPNTSDDRQVKLLYDTSSETYTEGVLNLHDAKEPTHEKWWDWKITVPDEISQTETCALVVSYAASGSSERKTNYFNKWHLGNIWFNGVTYPTRQAEVATLSIVLTKSPQMPLVDYGYPVPLLADPYISSSQVFDTLESINGFVQWQNSEFDYYYNNNKKFNGTISSYDVNFMYDNPSLNQNTSGNSGTGSYIKPFMTKSIFDNVIKQENEKFQTTTEANDIVGYYASGHLGGSDCFLEEFGFSYNYLIPQDRKALVDNVNNLGGVLNRDTDEIFALSDDKISFVVKSGVGPNNDIGGMFNDNYAVSSNLDINITDLQLSSIKENDAVLFWGLYPFPDSDDLVFNIVASHDGNAEPTIYCDIVDKEYVNTYPLTESGGNYNTHKELNKNGVWNSNRVTIPYSDQNVVQKYHLSGTFDGGCGAWDLKDKVLQLKVEYPESGYAYSDSLDIYAMDLRVDWFKEPAELTGVGVNDETTLDLFIKGNSKIAKSGDMDLFIMNEGVDDNMTLFASAANGFPSGITPLFSAGSTSGFSTLYNNTPLITRGQGVSNSSVDLMMGVQWPAQGLPLYIGKSIPDSQVTVEPMNLMINGNYSSDTEKAANLYIYGVGQYGDVDPESVLPLYIQQGSSSDDRVTPEGAMNMFLQGRVYEYDDNVSLSLINNKTESTGGVDLVIRRAGTEGAYSSTGNIPLYIERVPASEGAMGLYVLGHDSPITSGTSMFITGKLPTETLDTNLFMANYNQTDNLEIYMRGF
jgi:hypothetical protein